MGHDEMLFAAKYKRRVRATHEWHWTRRFALRLAVTDALVIFAAIVFGYLTLFDAEQIEVTFRGWSILVDYIVFDSILALGWMAVLELSSSRARGILGFGVTEYRRVISASFALFGGLVVTAFFLAPNLSRGHLLVTFGVGLCALLLSRWMWRKWLVLQRRRSKYCWQVVLVGSAESVASVSNQLERIPAAGKKVVGAVIADDLKTLPTTIASTGGAMDEVLATLYSLSADTVIVTANAGLDQMMVRSLSWSLDPVRHQLMLVPGIADIGGPRVSMSPVPEMHLIQIDLPQPALASMLGKRCFDVIGASVLLILSLPIQAIAGLFIWLEDRGPIIFGQDRVGLNGGLFRIFKLRTMALEAEAKLPGLLPENAIADGVLFKLRDDPRVTRVGRVLRRWSIDELPQLLNVVIGSMSLVGPRPHLPSEVAKFEEHAHRRFLVKPGITGPWQVGGRSNLSWEEAIRLDLHYVENWSITGDLRILWRTIKAVFSAEGAY